MTIARTYHGIAAATGPLLILEGARRARLGEWVRVETPGSPPRRGQVIDTSEPRTVIQLLAEPDGISPDRAEVTLTGTVARVPVGRELLGRSFDGLGQPIDGLPSPVGTAVRPIEGAPMNPACRSRPVDFIETGISAIDGLNTLVRGQKLPIFAGPGLPALDLAARIVEGARAPRGEPFAVVFVAMGITARETQGFLTRFMASDVMERTILVLNEAGQPAVERLLAPRIGLTAAEYLAFDAGMQVLVVMADMTHYCDALREIAAAREEMPGRRGYPGYMYTDLAGLFERAGVLRGRAGSITQVPVVTTPEDDLTHPIPDLTGYITEGQIVLSREMHQRGISPPIDVLPSLSRLMRAGIGAAHTRSEHAEWSDQLYAAYARGREARSMAAVLGASGLPEDDRRAFVFADAFETEFIAQSGRRTMAETFEAGWRVLDRLPRSALQRVSDATWERRQRERSPAQPGGVSRIPDHTRET